MEVYFGVLCLGLVVIGVFAYTAYKALDLIGEGVQVLSKFADVLLRLVNQNRTKDQNFNLALDAFLLLFCGISAPIVFRNEDGYYALITIVLAFGIIAVCLIWTFRAGKKDEQSKR